ncbi:MAG: hypothetical protein U1E76_27695 [Planctomycetota bacterium]
MTITPPPMDSNFDTVASLVLEFLDRKQQDAAADPRAFARGLPRPSCGTSSRACCTCTTTSIALR